MIFLIFLCLGSSTVKGMALDSCLVFNEGDSKLYTNIEFCEEKNHRQFENILYHKAKEIMLTIFFRKVYIF
jgi:hypothetical protein